MTYHVQYTSAAARQIERLPRGVQLRVVGRIQLLASTPRPPGAVKLAGQDAYRIRAGNYRVVYGIADELLLVVIIRIGHRRDVCRG